MATMIVYLADAAYLGLSPATIGVVFAIGNIGALVGALTANRLAARFGVGPAIIGSLAVGSLNPLLIALAPAAMPVPFLVAGGLLGGFSGMAYNINQVSYRQAICPPRMQGRMNATIRFLVWGTHADRRHHRRHPGDGDRRPRDDLDRRDPRAHARALPAALARAAHPDDAGAGRGRSCGACAAAAAAGAERERVRARQPEAQSSSIGMRTPRSRATSIARS